MSSKSKSRYTAQMLSYRHAFHAGNFADVHKHLGLMLCLESLCKKEKSFSVLDTHAGAGLYTLDDERALLTGETNDGIVRLLSYCEEHLPPSALGRYISLISPYIKSNSYPGSPEIERSFLRDNDCLTLIELHSTEINILRAAMEGGGKDPRIHIHFRDAYEACRALCPPHPRRGLLIMDPSYEVDSDYENTVHSLEVVHKKWAEGIKILWYPVINHRSSEISKMKSSLEEMCERSNTPHLCSELILKPGTDDFGMTGSGLFFMGVPWLLEDQLRESSAFLKEVFK